MQGGSWTPSLWLILECGRNAYDGKMGDKVIWFQPFSAERWSLVKQQGGQAESWSEFSWITQMRPTRIPWLQCYSELYHLYWAMHGELAYPKFTFTSPLHPLISIALKYPEKQMAKWFLSPQHPLLWHVLFKIFYYQFLFYKSLVTFPFGNIKQKDYGIANHTQLYCNSMTYRYSKAKKYNYILWVICILNK